MTFYEIEFPLAALDSDAVEAALQDIGASSITYVDRGDEPVLEPMPGEVRLWSDTLVRALFQATADPALNLDRLAVTLGSHITRTARVHAVREREWVRAWLDDWKSMRFGRRLWVCPFGADPPADADAIVVWLDPGLAFGTGTHPTTALCLEALDSLPLTGREIIDYGCGSGVLGIAALKLGARRVTAIDLDPQALLATRDNAERNGVSAGIEVHAIDAHGNQRPLRAAFCVVANILAGPLIELAPKLSAAVEPAGWLLLSGVLNTQADAVTAAYASAFAKVEVIEKDGWCCLRARQVA